MVATLALAGCATSQPPALPARGQDLRVLVEQAGKPLAADGRRVRLQRKPFTLVVTFRPDQNLRLNASYDSAVFDPACAGAPRNDLECFGLYRGMAEGARNSDNDLMIDPTAHHSWFYSSPSVHRFNEARRWGRWVEGRRTVSTLFELPDRVKTPLDGLKQPGLFLVFLTDTGPFDKLAETGRQCLELVFE